ncbi:MAG: hypothetical protein FWD23_06495 [Oscillospiraceae bacterium]|nr:hypothetical protein [Oscillospiraceae bacterium]
MLNKKIMLPVSVFVVLLILLSSCSDSNGKFLTGNEPNNTVFLYNLVCDDKDYVYFSDADQNIKRITKKDNSVTELNQKGYNLNLYDGYLYFVSGNLLYRSDERHAFTFATRATGTPFESNGAGGDG